MLSVPPSIVAESAVSRQNVVLSSIKQSAEQSQKLAEIIQESQRSVPVSSARGSQFSGSV